MERAKGHVSVGCFDTVHIAYHSPLSMINIYSDHFHGSYLLSLNDM